MENNVGKIKFLMVAIVAFSTSCMAAYVDLNVTSMDGSQLHQVGLGQPFLMSVTISGHTDAEPKVEGLEHFQLMGKSKRMSTINGRTTISYSYQVYGNEVGNFTIGPAIVDSEGTSKQSNSRSIRVEQESADKPQQSGNKESAKLQLLADKSHVVVGEKIHVILQFSGNSDEVRLEQISKPHIDAIVDSQSGPATHNEAKNGKTWTVAHWTFDVRPDKPGKLVIPACSADVAIQKEVNDQLSAFSLFFRYRNELRKIYSNVLTIQIDELPVSKNSIQAVGIFEYLHAAIKPAVAKEGEGMVLTLELKGNAPFNAIETPQLQNMPQPLKWYESKHFVQDSQNGKDHAALNFEYVVQGLQQGNWEIPAQQFTYFDTKSRSIKTLKSTAITVSIQPNGARTVSEHSSNASAKNDNVPQQEELSPIITGGEWQAVQPTHIPWLLFFIIALAPLLWALWKSIQIYGAHCAPYFMRRHAFKYARKQIKIASSTGSHNQLLGIIIRAIALRLDVSPSLISQEVIEQKLADAGMAAQKIKEFDLFITMLHEHSFYKEHAASGDEFLFAQASKWLDELEQLL